MSRLRTQFIDSVRRLFCLRRPFSQAVLLTCFAALAGVAGQARAEDDVLKLVPEKALGFVVVNRPETADAKLQELGQQLKLPIPSLLTKLEGPGGISTALDKKRPVALLVLPPKDDASIPAVIVLAPVEDYAKFLEQFKSNETEAGVTKIDLFHSAKLVRSVGSYAAITEEPCRDALKDLKAADEVPAALAPWQTWLAKKDAAAVVLTPGIRLASEKLQQGIAAAKMAMSQMGAQGQQALAGLEMYVTFFKAAEKEVASFGISLERNRQGVVRLCQRACLVPGGSWGRSIGDSKPAEQVVLAGLPAGPFVFAGGGSLSESSMPSLMNWSFGMIKSMREMYGLSEEQADELSKLAEVKFPPIRGFSFELGLGADDEPILSRMVGVMRPADGKTYLADYEKYAAAYNKIVEKIESPVFRPLKCEKIEVDGIASLKVTVTMPQMPNMPPQTAKLMESMYGTGGKMVARIVPVDENTVLFSYAGDEPLHKAIAAVKEGKPGLAGDAGVAKAAALLPPGALCRIYLSPAGTLDFVKRAVALVMPAGANVHIPEFPATPPIAVGVMTGRDEVEAQVIVPAEVFQEIGRLVNPPVEGAH